MTARSIALEIFRSEGLKSFWKGVTARLLGALPFSVLGIIGYEFVKRQAVRPNNEL